MTAHTLTLAADSHAEAHAFAGGGLASGVTLMIVGMGVVFAALAVILLVIAGMNRLLRERAPAPAPVAPAAPTDAIAPETLAVLAAAATAALNAPVRIRRITVLGGPAGAAWIAGGRASVMGQNRPQRPRR